MIELRSDTFTRPTPAMLQAMFSAPVGDDVFGEDPTVNELEDFAANLFGMEAALYCPSGTMTNQIAIKVHTRPGDEVICESQAHVYIYEGGGIAFNSSAQARTLPGIHGRITAEQVASAVNPEDVHKSHSTLVCLENTSNRGGGTCYNWDEMTAIRRVCDENGMSLHLDGARLFNALVAKSESPGQYGGLFNSISICLSKGLGAPVGSLLLGNKDFILQARRVRKVFGGGMRQAGFMAAAGLYSLKHNVERLQQDHNHALHLSQALQTCSWVAEVFPTETNIVIARVKPAGSAPAIAQQFKDAGVSLIAISPDQIRMVTHLDVSASDIEKTLEIIGQIKR
ncbi:MAG: aminotransferase class I/II-fold pyridoxal phosphate-dependent enzyme [Bacteroidetes bacterium]|nr:aminotransferase class I/II-fold pyridoxal phosphate-dependent enzyme [Bacteroidota bacterium]